jgi:hypothetical protein
MAEAERREVPAARAAAEGPGRSAWTAATTRRLHQEAWVQAEPVGPAAVRLAPEVCLDPEVWPALEVPPDPEV